MKDHEVMLAGLLYAAPDSLLPPNHHERLAGLLDSREARQAYAKLLTERMLRQRKAGFIWDTVALGREYRSSEEPLIAASAELARALEARRVHNISMPRKLWLVFMLGLACGLLGVLLVRYLAGGLL